MDPVYQLCLDADPGCAAIVTANLGQGASVVFDGTAYWLYAAYSSWGPIPIAYFF